MLNPLERLLDDRELCEWLEPDDLEPLRLLPDDCELRRELWEELAEPAPGIRDWSCDEDGEL